jgi:hypothetical protein
MKISTLGYSFLANGVVSWTSKKQRAIALSNIEYKYMGLFRASIQAIWLRRLVAKSRLETKKSYSYFFR